MTLLDQVNLALRIVVIYEAYRHIMLSAYNPLCSDRICSDLVGDGSHVKALVNAVNLAARTEVESKAAPKYVFLT